ncbi:cytochrome P450 family protein [Melittangium boletus]|uniref:Cytochrome P450 hydroxylase n=1 Tax=Melittangium boletus DSM 14713 TaxID=1294270 RepID=A0A250IC57_9BACT|nr:cytochrome P450 [Melittangium boletus]ATB28741.1 cytochrome P450 hydroxylase [Melittangium boletus DSM 14713]
MSTTLSPQEIWAPHTRFNPLPLYARMRPEGPLFRQMDANRGVPIWLSTRYKASVELLRDPRFTKDERLVAPQARQARVAEMEAINRNMLMSDPPDHTRLRTLVSKAFLPRRVEELRSRVEAIAHRLLDALPAQGSVDLIDAFAFRIPVTVIAELLGVPPEDQDQFRVWTTAITQLPSADRLESIKQASLAFMAYVQNLMEKRRAEPREDLVSDLLQAEEQGDRLSSEELIGMVVLLLNAGHETTVNLIGNGVWALLRHPEQLERLRQNPALIDSAVEEMLRYRGPLECATHRWAREDIEFHGQVIPAGETVLVSLLAANHDPEQFPEPERFDITREPNRHIAFGFGIHFCVGAPLARLEASIALPLLLERLPRLRLAVDESQLQWRQGLVLHGLKQLPVAF